jgi:hypothetical protein
MKGVSLRGAEFGETGGEAGAVEPGREVRYGQE